jgi:hypothetical protein
MKNKYRIRLTAKNEGLEYRDELNVYRFGVRLVHQEWVVYLPCTKGDQYELYEMNNDEKEIILSRIESFLKRIRWFGFWGRSYLVRFENQPAK